MPGAAQTIPPGRHNLPLEMTSFIGRARALAELKPLLAGARLLTITGPGGCGKTRIALRLAAEAAGRSRDGVWLVELATIAEPTQVPAAVASVLGVEAAGAAPLEALTLALASKQLLLVLDNCEHVIAACAALVERLLRDCPDLRVLATSREPLRCAGETVYALAPLDLPADAERPSSAALAQSEAMRLFVERASSRLPAFRLDDENATAVAEICRRLDGLPLAIELAAALVASFPVQQLAGLLDHALPLLVGGRRTEQRQTTLRAAIDWSYAMLGAAERVLFRRLAVFRGGWDFSALAGVCLTPAAGLTALDRSAAPGVFATLIEKSMVVTSDSGATPRYRLLEPVRQFAAELLASHGELDALQRAHACYFTALAGAEAPALFSASREPALERLAANIENFRAALTWALPDGGDAADEQAELGLRLAPALFGYWHFRGPRVEGYQWVEAALRGLGSRSDAVAAEALHVSGEFAFLLGDYDRARTRLEASAALWRRLANPRGLAYTLQALAPLAHGTRRQDLANESLALFEQIGDAWGGALVRFDIGLIAHQEGDAAAARRCMDAAAAQFLALGDRWFAAQVLIDRGDIERGEGRLAAAASSYARALTLVEECRDTILLPSVLFNLGIVAREQGHTRRALQYLRQALVQFRDRADLRGIAECLIGIGGVLGAMQQPERAVRLFGAAEAVLARAGAELWMTNTAAYARDREAMRARLSAEAFALAWAAGRSLSPVQALAEALPEPGRAALAAAAARPPIAASQRFEQLTPREREVAALVARGYGNRQIAAALVISTGTAGLHVKHILHKLGFDSRSQLAAWAASSRITGAPATPPS